MAHTKNMKDTTIDISKAGVIHIQFDIGSISSVESGFIQTFIKHIKFYIVKANIPSFFYFADIDRLSFYFNNIDNLLVMKSTRISDICCFDHPFLLGQSNLNSFITLFFDYNFCYLTEAELRQTYRRFKHPFAIKLPPLLERQEPEINKSAID